MSLQVLGISDGVLTVQLKDKLGESELRQFQESIPALLQQHGPFRLLVDAGRFGGWGPGDWASSAPHTRYDAQINRIAVLCDRKWQELAMMFAGKGLRPAEVEVFEPAEQARANAWLRADVGPKSNDGGASRE